MSGIEHDAARGEFHLEIFDEHFSAVRAETRDPIVTGRQVAELGQKRPVDDFYVLLRSPRGGILELALDESVDLRETSSFYAVASDRLFKFFIDGVEFTWPLTPVRGDTLYRLAGANSAESVLILVGPDGADKPLDAGGEVDLAEPGVEHFSLRPRKRSKTIYVDDRPIVVEEDGLSGAQIKVRAGIEANYQLFLEQPGEDIAITDDYTVKIVDGLRFYSLPPATFG